ncbi:TolC family protein [Halioxenophilus sp. WMMB6]|uniref:TolC family protein n=1 Tax=Halioxenophilus sp. WMMB6 TaxID=3073815 RepID=UPI00295E59D7|nr:TolC family protein [Halioxenophilus sp. WMMB6]
MPRFLQHWAMALLLGTATSAMANEAAEAHSAVVLSERLTLAEVVTAALARAPEQSIGGAYQQQAEQQTRFSRSLSPAPARLNLSYWDDASFDNLGNTEAEAGVEFDLWRLGEKRNARQLAEAYSNGSQNWQQHLTLLVAGRVRQSLAQLTLARLNLNHAEQALADSEALLAISNKRLAAGEVAESTVLQSEALVLDAKQQLLASQAEMVDAERSYHLLTGLDAAPKEWLEALPEPSEITPEHPQLAYLLGLRQQQLAATDQQRHQTAGNATLGIGVRRQQAADNDPQNDSLGLSLSIPFGGKSYSRVQSSAASVALAELDARIEQARLDLKLQLHEVEHQLHTLESALAYAQQSRELTQRQWQMAKTAFALGESTIQPTILALQQHRQSELRWLHLRLRQQALISTYKQTLGELP